MSEILMDGMLIILSPVMVAGLSFTCFLSDEDTYEGGS